MDQSLYRSSRGLRSTRGCLLAPGVRRLCGPRRPRTLMQGVVERGGPRRASCSGRGARTGASQATGVVPRPERSRMALLVLEARPGASTTQAPQRSTPFVTSCDKPERSACQPRQSPPGHLAEARLDSGTTLGYSDRRRGLSRRARSPGLVAWRTQSLCASERGRLDGDCRRKRDLFERRDRTSRAPLGHCPRKPTARPLSWPATNDRGVGLAEANVSWRRLSHPETERVGDTRGRHPLVLLAARHPFQRRRLLPPRDSGRLRILR